MQINGYHVLVSTRLGRATVHGYLARRRKNAKHQKSDLAWISNAVIETTEKMADKLGEVWFLPVLLSTQLDAAAGELVREVLLRGIQTADDDPDPLAAFEAGKEPLFIGVWLMPSDDPDCERLMELH
jgi:hypothetical protein